MRISDWSSDVCSSDLVCDLIERRAELRLHVGAVVPEGDARGHVEQQIVALADDLHVGARGLGAQIALLLVHIGAAARPREAADARADDLFGAIVAHADEIAEQIPAQSRAAARPRGPGTPPLARPRTGGHTRKRG